jgi:hypothetical protein
MRPGQRIKLRAFAGIVIERIVIQRLNEVVVICQPEEWHAARREGREPSGVGFPVSAIIVKE